MASDLVPKDPGEFLFYQTEDGGVRLQVRMEGETVWLSQKAMAELFQKDVRTISEHIRNIFEEGELQPDSVVRKFRVTAGDYKQYDTQHYNLDVIISVGYRVKSLRGTQFRIWATVSSELRFEVSRKLKEDFENGRDYYALRGRERWLPMAVGERPRAEYLAWHREARWLG